MPTKHKGAISRAARWWFWKRTRWDHGAGHVALHTNTTWALMWFGSSTQLCCVGSRQWRWGSSWYVKLTYTWPMYWVKEACGFDFEYSTNIWLRLTMFLLSLHLCLAQRLICIDLFYIHHIALCMCNSLECWFKHPLPYPVSFQRPHIVFII